MGQEFPRKTSRIGEWRERRRREPRANLRDGIFQALSRARAEFEKYELGPGAFRNRLSLYSPFFGDGPERIITIKSLHSASTSWNVAEWMNYDLIVQTATYKKGSSERAQELTIRVGPAAVDDSGGESVWEVRGEGKALSARARDIKMLADVLDRASPLDLLAKEAETGDLDVRYLLHPEPWNDLAEADRDNIMARKLSALQQLRGRPILRKMVIKEMIESFLEGKNGQELVSDHRFRLLEMAPIPPDEFVELFTPIMLRGDFPQNYLIDKLDSWSNLLGRLEEELLTSKMLGTLAVLSPTIIYILTKIDSWSAEAVYDVGYFALGTALIPGVIAVHQYLGSVKMGRKHLREGIAALKEVLKQREVALAAGLKPTSSD